MFGASNYRGFIVAVSVEPVIIVFFIVAVFLEPVIIGYLLSLYL